MFQPRIRIVWVAVCAVAVVGVLCLSIPRAFAEVTAEQQAQAKAIDKKIIEAGQLLRKKQTDEAAKLLTEAQTELFALAASGSGADFDKVIRAPMARLKITRRLMQRAGVKLPALPDLSKKKKDPQPAPKTDAVSFKDDVAPILVANCNGCHIQRNRGRLSMASYNALMQGVAGASVIQRGDAKKSRLMEVLEKGEMPQGGRKLNAENLTKIATWINQGARFDGDNPAGSIAPNTPAPKRPKLQVTQATGKETIKFSRDIAPVLVESCIDCHGGQRPRGRLGLDTFARLLRGGDTGVIVNPGKPADSLLIGKLKGTAEGARMPAGGRKPLSDKVIAMFEKWIAEGAKFDGPEPDMSTTMVARIYAVSQMSHDELAKDRVGLADKNWVLANPDDKPAKYETDNFLMVGNVGEGRLKEIAKVAESLRPRVGAMLGATASQPLVKGRLTIFVFDKRFEYSEYGRMVEGGRSIPRDWYGHWRYTIVDAYACLYPPKTEEDGKLESLVAEQIAGTVIDSAGNVPDWFAQGSAWEIAARIDRKDPRVLKWSKRLPDILKQMEAADDFLTGKLPAGDAAVVNHSFAKYLMSKSTTYKSLLGALRKGADFKQAFVRTYRTAPNDVAKQGWAPWVRRQR